MKPFAQKSRYQSGFFIAVSIPNRNGGKSHIKRLSVDMPRLDARRLVRDLRDIAREQ